jgi:hypothetical protein
MTTSPARVEQAARVIDQCGARLDRGGDRLGTPGVDRDQHAVCGERAHQRTELCDLLLDADRLRVGAAREHADVDNRGAGSDELESALQLLFEALEGARVRHRVAADIEDPHDDRLARPQLERRLR